jgi:predicted MPP superfamily phosphohydrolase
MLRFYTLIFLLHAYLGWSLLPDLPTGAFGVAALALWLVASANLIPLALISYRTRKQPLAELMAWAGLIAIGSFSSLLVLTLFRDVVLLVGSGASGWVFAASSLETFRAYSAAAVPILAGLFTLVGFINARRRAKVRSVEIPITDLPASLHGFTIAQISDVHVGLTIRRKYLEAIVDAVNDLAVDLIAVTGDLVDGSVHELAQHTQPMARLSARHGVYFVTGNHEYYSGVKPWIEELRRLGLRVLVNEHVVLQHQGVDLVVAGVTDYSAHHYDPAHRSDPHAAIAGAPAGAAVKVLLAHQPRSAAAAEAAGYHLQLSGHTHGGQFFPWNFFVRLQQPFTAGLHRLGSLWVYTSRGTGYWGPPKRLFAPSEITRLTLVPA